VSAGPSRGFRIWAVGAALSSLGDAITFFAIAWVAAGHGPGTASLVVTAESLPLCFLILAGGIAADRWGIRAVLLACDAAMALVMTAVAVAAPQQPSAAVLAAVAFLSGSAAALRRPAASSFPRLFADGDELARLVASVTALVQASRLTGPVAAGFLLGLDGLRLTSAVDAVTFAVVGSVVLAIRPPLAVGGSAVNGGGALREAVRAARHAPGVPALLLTTAALAVTVLPLVELCVPLAGRAHGWGAAGTGMVAAAWPVGGIVVSVVVARRGAPGPRSALGGPLVAAIGALGLAVSSAVPVAAASVGLVGAGTAVTTARLYPRFAGSTAPALLARFQSFLGLAQTGPVLVATPVFGLLAVRWGTGAVLLLIAAVLVGAVPAVHRVERTP
jgi:MFS family permease